MNVKVLEAQEKKSPKRQRERQQWMLKVQLEGQERAARREQERKGDAAMGASG
jgi:hypothetical protein